MSHPENSKAPAVAQQASETQCVAFLQSAGTGHCILEVRGGVPVEEVMECYEEVLDGLTAFIRRMSRDASIGIDEAEAAVLALLTELIGAMTAACSRGMAAGGGVQ